MLKKYDLACAMVSNPTGKTPQGVTVGGIPRAWNRVEHHDTLVELYEKRIAEVADAGFETVICRMSAPYDNETIDRMAEVRELLDA